MRHIIDLVLTLPILVGLPLALAGSAAASEDTQEAPPVLAPAQLSEGGLALALPAPTGRWSVGVRTTFLEDPSRLESETGAPRTLPIRVWYPASSRAAPPARYASAILQPVLEASLGLPSGSFDLDIHALQDACVHEHVRGVILASAGYQEPAAFQTGHVIDLASRGWVVVTIDHPHDTLVVDQPDGSLIYGQLTSDEAFEPRVADVGLVLAHLSDLVPGWSSELPVGMFGHSLGGSAAAEALLLYPQLRAAVDLDGSARGQVFETTLDKPFGAMLSTIRTADNVDDGFEAWFARLRGPHRLVQLDDVYHDGFSDFVVFNPEASAFDPALGSLLESQLRTDVETVAAGVSSLAEQRRFLASFFARYLGSS
ncbi:MAG: hypothetical protein RL033_3892 [Pseudomonadota bacterium]